MNLSSIKKFFAKKSVMFVLTTLVVQFFPAPPLQAQTFDDGARIVDRSESSSTDKPEFKGTVVAVRFVGMSRDLTLERDIMKTVVEQRARVLTVPLSSKQNPCDRPNQPIICVSVFPVHLGGTGYESGTSSTSNFSGRNGSSSYSSASTSGTIGFYTAMLQVDLYAGDGKAPTPLGSNGRQFPVSTSNTTSFTTGVAFGGGNSGGSSSFSAPGDPQARATSELRGAFEDMMKGQRELRHLGKRNTTGSLWNPGARELVSEVYHKN